MEAICAVKKASFDGVDCVGEDAAATGTVWFRDPPDGSEAIAQYLSSIFCFVSCSALSAKDLPPVRVVCVYGMSFCQILRFLVTFYCNKHLYRLQTTRSRFRWGIS